MKNPIVQDPPPLVPPRIPGEPEPDIPNIPLDTPAPDKQPLVEPPSPSPSQNE